MKKFTGLNCEHKKETAEFVNQVRYLRCVKCQTVRLSDISTPKQATGHQLIKDFTSLPDELQEQRHEAFSEACKDADLQEMYDLSRQSVRKG